MRWSILIFSTGQSQERNQIVWIFEISWFYKVIFIQTKRPSVSIKALDLKTSFKKFKINIVI